MNRLQRWWLHFRYHIWGDAKYEEMGQGIIPCKRCGKFFKSYQHFDGYDAYCEWCAFENRVPRQLKKEMEDILSKYDKDEYDWDTTIGCLRSVNIRVRREKWD